MNNLKIHTTKDGSLSLHSCRYEEDFHDKDGALRESIAKYLIPAQLEQFFTHEKIAILDVCMGLGYNTGCILEKFFQSNIKEIEWHGLEIDKRPLNLALNEKAFQKIWTPKVLDFFNCINKSGKWTEGTNEGNIHWGDARQKIYEIQNSVTFDLILLDPFSPQKCPELWSEEFISLLTERLSTEGRLITYSTAASIRASLKKAGLNIYSIIPLIGDQHKWSSGTVAMRKEIEQHLISQDYMFKDLSTREIEHLATRSSIPYRDPTGKATSKEIISTRNAEQSKSQLINTSSWRKRWDTAQKQ